jgi:glycopeptide antibiotics resistance protein
LTKPPPQIPEKANSLSFRRGSGVRCFLLYLLFLILMTILPLNGSSSAHLNDILVVNIRLDYLIHSILFIPWIFLYLISFRPAGIWEKLLMIAAGLLMAFSTEGVQYFLSYRSYNINDLLSNFLGVILGAIALFFIPQINQK